MNTLTRTNRVSFGEDTFMVQEADPNATSDRLPEHESTTSTLTRIARNKMVPLLFGFASFAAPAPSVKHVFSTAAISRSAVVEGSWLLTLDGFQYTEEEADPQQVRALNALLYLPVATGFELDLPD
ncbi:MAG: hypothetical protein WKF96_19410 [Solirubrobacteraceae bacterium]